MKFDRSFGFTESSPGKNRQTKIDNGAIKQVEIFQFETVAGG
jgi:hypothetical protein